MFDFLDSCDIVSPIYKWFYAMILNEFAATLQFAKKLFIQLNVDFLPRFFMKLNFLLKID